MINKTDYTSLISPYTFLKIIGQVADQQQVATYVVGGFVRDLCLERTSKDIDIVCVGSGIQLAEGVAAAMGKDTKVVVFKNFGTAMLQWEEWEVEFVGARKESYRTDSRKPIVETGSLVDDQNRRDFTINAMAIALNSDTYGELVDPFNGIGDLAAGIIQTPCNPGKTFSDDPLRMLRAIRFATQLNFKIAAETLTAIEQYATRIKIISKERIITELDKIVASHIPSIGFKLLLQTKLLPIIFPEMAALQGKETINGQSHKDNFYHTLAVLDNVAKKSDKLWLRWAAIFHDIAKPLTKKFDDKVGFTFHGHEDLGARMVPPIFKKMRLPLNESMRYVQKLVRLHLRPIALVKEVTDAAIRRLVYDVGDDLDDLMLLCRADITSKNELKVQQYLGNFNRVVDKIKEVEARDQIRNFQPVITGEIIMQTFGIKPSPVVGVIKQAIKEAILEGVITNDYAIAYQYMLKLGKIHQL